MPKERHDEPMTNLTTAPLTRGRLATAGRLAMVSALLTVPWIVLTLFLAEKDGVGLRAGQTVLLLAGTVIYVFLMATLRRLFHEKYAYVGTDAIIALLIKANVVSAVVSAAGLVVPALESSLAVFGIIVAAFLGILQLLFGLRLFTFPDPLRGLHRPYCWLNIVTGFCVAVIVLLPIGMVASAVADVMLGTIFFQAAREAKKEPADRDDPHRRS
jgi:hypothetical protein